MKKPERPSSEPDPPSADLEEAGTVAGTVPPLGDKGHAAPPGLLVPTDLPLIERTQYDIEREHARGGLGRILQGRDRRLDRPVAIKELLAPSPQAQARFVREALVSARLQHPAIVPVYEAGRWPDGEPFYAMKMITGRSLKEIIEEAQSLDQRLALLPHILAVADAMAYAHEQRVIHRDLKPANVLVGRFGETVVIDWGLAKDLACPDPTDDLWDSPYRIVTHDLTIAGAVMGTPQYMPPEQARGEPANERADVYAIGAMLYHVLAGLPPYTGEHSKDVLAQLLAGPPRSLEQQQPGIPKDLVTIVRKAMARSPGDRYPSARTLAEDLRRFQTGQLVAAHEYSRLTLLRRWLRRYRLPVGVAGLALVILTTGGGLAFRRIVHERRRAEQERAEAEAERNRVILEQARGLLERDPTAAVTVLKTYPEDGAEGSTRRELMLIAQSLGVATHVLRGDPGKFCYGDFSPTGELFASSGLGRVLALWDVRKGRVATSWPVQQPVYGIRFSPDGRRLAYMGPQSHELLLRDLETGEERPLAVGRQAIINNFFFSPGGESLLVVTDTRALYLWAATGGAPRILEGHEPSNYYVAFSVDGQTIAYAGEDRSVRLYRRASGQVRSLRGHDAAITAIAFSPDGKRLGSTSRDGILRLWDAASGESLQVLRGHQGPIHSLAFSPDGERLATGGADRTLRIWTVATGKADIEGHEGQVFATAFSPDGRYLAWAGAGPAVRLRDTVTQESRSLSGHRAEIYQLRFSSDGRYLASSSNDKTTRLWTITPGQGRALHGHEDNVQDIMFSPDGRLLASGSRDHTIRLWDTATGEPARIWRGHDNLVTRAVFSRDGAHLASASWDKKVRLWDVRSGASRVLEGHKDLVWDVEFSPDGRRLASSGEDGVIWLWDVATGQGRSWPDHEGAVYSLAMSPDGTWLASAGDDANVRLWHLATGTCHDLRGHASSVALIAFSPDGRWLASAGEDNAVWLWDIAQAQGRPLGRHPTGIHALRFTPDARFVLTGDEEGVIRGWDTRGPGSRTVAALQAQIRKLEFTADGRLLAALSADGVVWLWTWDGGTLRGVYRECRGGVDIAFSPDGERLACGGADWNVHLWSTNAIPEERPAPASLRSRLATLTSAVLLPSGLPSTLP